MRYALYPESHAPHAPHMSPPGACGERLPGAGAHLAYPLAGVVGGENGKRWADGGDLCMPMAGVLCEVTRA